MHPPPHQKLLQQTPHHLCHLAAYIALRKDQVAMEFDGLPVDGKGKCVFHSHDLKWKRAQRCGERFLDLCRAMASEAALLELDFREFWLTGSNFGQKGRPAPNFYKKILPNAIKPWKHLELVSRNRPRCILPILGKKS